MLWILRIWDGFTYFRISEFRGSRKPKSSKASNHPCQPHRCAASDGRPDSHGRDLAGRDVDQSPPLSIVNLAAQPHSAQNDGVAQPALGQRAGKGLSVPVRQLAASLILASFAAYGQALLDDATIEKLVKDGVGEQTIVALIDKQPGKYALSSDDLIALAKAGVSSKILAAMIVRNGSDSSAPPAATNRSTAPVALALHDGTPIRLRLARDLTFTNIRPGEMADFEIVDDLRIDGVLVIAHGVRVTATITEAEPRTRLGRGGKLGVNLDSVPLSNGGKAAIRAAKEGQAGAHAEATGGEGVAAAMVRPAAPSLLFVFGRDEAIPAGTGIAVYIDGEIKLDPARFLVDIAFTSNPPGALVTMYGAAVGRTPFTTRLAPGTYKAVFSADGYRDLTKGISVGPGYSNTVHAAFQPKP